MAICVPCLGRNVKEAILKALPELKDAVEGIADCEDPAGLALCGRSGGRRRSAYNEFISRCLKSKGIKGFGQAASAMKECATEWRKK